MDLSCSLLSALLGPERRLVRRQQTEPQCTLPAAGAAHEHGRGGRGDRHQAGAALGVSFSRGGAGSSPAGTGAVRQRQCTGAASAGLQAIRVLSVCSHQTALVTTPVPHTCCAGTTSRACPSTRPRCCLPRRTSGGAPPQPSPPPPIPTATRWAGRRGRVFVFVCVALAAGFWARAEGQADQAATPPCLAVTRHAMIVQVAVSACSPTNLRSYARRSTAGLWALHAGL